MRKKSIPNYLLSFGKNLKKIREQKKLTQFQLASDCNFEISQISRIERGIIDTSICNAYLLAKNLEIPVKDLFDFEYNEEL